MRVSRALSLKGSKLRGGLYQKVDGNIGVKRLVNYYHGKNTAAGLAGLASIGNSIRRAKRGIVLARLM